MSVTLTSPEWDALMQRLNRLAEAVRKATLVRGLAAAGEVVARQIGKNAPRSASSRGPNTGKTQGWRTGAHGADNVKREKPVISEFAGSVRVGWDTRANDPHFYMKFSEFGTSSMQARPFMELSLEQAENEAQDAIAREVMQEMANG